MLYLVGEEPVEAWARGESFLREGVEDVVFCYLRFPSGVVAHMHLSWLDPHKMRKLTVVGRDKMAVFDDMEQERKLTVHDKGPIQLPASEWQVRTGDIHIPRIPTEEPLRIECRHFVSLVTGEADRLAPARDGLAVVRTLENAPELARPSARVSIAETAVVYPGTVIGEGVVIGDHAVVGQAAGALAALDGVTRGAAAARLGPGRSSRPGDRLRRHQGRRARDHRRPVCVRERWTIGDDVVVGRGSLVENDTTVGALTKIQADAYITAYSTLEDNVFIAPCVVTTNDNFMGRTEQRHALLQGPTIRRGARVGGGAMLCPGSRSARRRSSAPVRSSTETSRRARSSSATPRA